MTESARQVECAPDAATFEAEVLPNLERLFCVAAWLTRDRAGAETLIQQTFTQALDSINRLEGEIDACVWLVRIMYEIKDKPHSGWKSWGKQVAEETGDAGETVINVPFEPPTPQDAAGEEILDPLRSLPSKHQEVVLLSEVEALTYKEIADVLNLTVGVVTLRLSHARLLLHANLRDCSNRRRSKSDKKVIGARGAE